MRYLTPTFTFAMQMTYVYFHPMNYRELPVLDRFLLDAVRQYASGFLAHT